MATAHIRLDRLKILELVDILSDDDVPELVKLKPKSDLTVASISRYQDVFQHFMNAGCRRLELDLASVTFLDSSGIGALAGVHKILLAKGGELVLSSVQPVVRNILRIVRFDQKVRVE